MITCCIEMGWLESAHDILNDVETAGSEFVSVHRRIQVAASENNLPLIEDNKTSVRLDLELVQKWS